jgi:uncharacterized membrane protein
MRILLFAQIVETKKTLSQELDILLTDRTPLSFDHSGIKMRKVFLGHAFNHHVQGFLKKLSPLFTEIRMDNELFRMFTVATVILSLVTIAGIIFWARDRKQALLRQKLELPPIHLRKKQLDEEILALEKKIDFLKSERQKMDEETS